MKYKLDITIKVLPKSVNVIGNAHWTVKHKESKLWDTLIFTETVNRRPKAPCKNAKIKYTRYSSQKMDFDNLAISFKRVQDALITCGIIAGDEIEHIGKPEYFHEYVKPKEGKIRIQLEEQ